MKIFSKRTSIIILRLLRPLIHAAIILILFYIMAELRLITDLIPFVQLRIPQIDIYETMLFALMAAGIFVFLGLMLGIYELFRPLHSYYKKFLSVWGFWLISSSFIAYMGFGYIFTNGISRFILLMGSVSTLIVLTFVDMIINIWNNYHEQKNPYKILLLSSDGKTAKKIEKTLGFYSMYHTQRIPCSAFSQNKVKAHDIIMVAGSIEKKLLQEIADTANIHGKLFYHVGDTLFLEDLIAKPERIGPLIALQYSSSSLDGRRRVVKRIFDILVAFTGLILLSPFLFLIAFLIKVDSSGPIFYIQDRVGKNKQLFRFIKFRSMYTHLSLGKEYGGAKASKVYDTLKKSKKNIRKGVLAKIKDDPRVTRIGRILRKTSLDELPSLLSVLLGHMSLVGPRPHMPDEVSNYNSRQERLFSIKPGITGYAQIFGRDKLSFNEEARLDLYYIQNRTLMLDIYVLVSTAKVVFSGK